MPEPGPGEVRVRLEGCGVCASNLPPWEGEPWFTYPMEPGALGHEGWGVVDARRRGRDRRCTSATGWRCSPATPTPSTTSRRPQRVVTLPDALAGQPFPGEPLGCAVNIFRRSGIKPGQTVAIVGIGFLGALLTRLASQAGARVIAVARRPFAQDVARAMGAADVMPMDDHWQIIEQVKQLTGGAFCDVVIEAVGKQWPLDLAAELSASAGGWSSPATTRTACAR